MALFDDNIGDVPDSYVFDRMRSQGSFGQDWYVKPGTGAGGSDSNTGLDACNAFATVSKALSKATAGKNDVIYVKASSNTAANTTDYQTATLAWTKDLTHLIGVNAGCKVSQRSRIATSSSAVGASVAPLFTLSANACRVEGLSFYAGAPGSGPTDALGCMLVSGSRNVIRGCHIAGLGDSTMDAAGQFSLKVTGSENLFDDCTIGLDTVARTTATYEMYMSGGATRNIFRNCRIITYAGAATMTFLTVPASGIDRWNLFENCIFINMPTGIASGTSMTQAFSVTGGGSPDGTILLKDCKIVGATASENPAGGKVGYFATGTGKMVFTAVA